MLRHTHVDCLFNTDVIIQSDNAERRSKKRFPLLVQDFFLVAWYWVPSSVSWCSVQSTHRNKQHGIVRQGLTYLLYACFAGDRKFWLVFGSPEISTLVTTLRIRNCDPDPPTSRDLQTVRRHSGQDLLQQHVICHTRRKTEL